MLLHVWPGDMCQTTQQPESNFRKLTERIGNIFQHPQTRRKQSRNNDARQDQTQHPAAKADAPRQQIGATQADMKANTSAVICVPAAELPSRMMLKAAPKAAPCETPKKPGSTSGLEKIIWNTLPAAESDIPNNKAVIKRGKRKFNISRRARSSSAKVWKDIKPRRG